MGYDFRAYRETATLCPVYAITPDDGYYLHTFYDVCPWSPSQRYLACTRFPFQDREPNHRDEAQICLIDMKDRSLTEVYSTTGWGFQLGSNVQWGGTDRYLYFNDKVDNEGVCVRRWISRPARPSRWPGPCTTWHRTTRRLSVSRWT